MALTIRDVRAGIKATLSASLTREINIDENKAGRPSPVIRIALDDAPTYWGSFAPRRLQSVRFRLTIDPAGTDQSAVIRLDDLLSSGTGNGSSVVDALEADETLGGVADTFDLEPGGYDPDQVAADLLLTVHVRGD